VNRKWTQSIIIFALLAGLFAWSPWITRKSAERRAVDSFNKAWESVADGCGINCEGCGAVSSRRVLFGVLVTIEYACGMIPADSPEYHRQSSVFVSTFGTAHGFPKP
jgi:hypothetical protein